MQSDKDMISDRSGRAMGSEAGIDWSLSFTDIMNQGVPWCTFGAGSWPLVSSSLGIREARAPSGSSSAEC